MILATDELMEVIEPALAAMLNVQVEVITFTDMKIEFALYSKMADQWVGGYVQVAYDTDLSVYIERPERHGGGYSYAGDINWCDILPEGIE